MLPPESVYDSRLNTSFSKLIIENQIFTPKVKTLRVLKTLRVCVFALPLRLHKIDQPFLADNFHEFVGQRLEGVGFAGDADV